MLLAPARPRPKPSQLRSRHALSSQREQDPESALMHYRARSYDPRTGRFAQRDPLKNLAIPEHYSYSHNLPSRYVDPLGMQAQQAQQNDPKAQLEQAVKTALEKELAAKAEVTKAAADAPKLKVAQSGWVKAVALRLLAQQFNKWASLEVYPHLGIHKIYTDMHVKITAVNTIVDDDYLNKETAATGRVTYASYNGVNDTITFSSKLDSAPPLQVIHETVHAIQREKLGKDAYLKLAMDNLGAIERPAYYVHQALDERDFNLKLFQNYEKAVKDGSTVLAEVGWSSIKRYAGGLGTTTQFGAVKPDDIDSTKKHLGTTFTEATFKAAYTTLAGSKGKKWSDPIK